MTNNQRLTEIDALRGIAALGVVLFHVKMLFIEDIGLFPRVGPIWVFIEGHLWSLVDLFFVISGYVFSHVYLDPAQSLIKRGVTVREYAAARLGRLYPLHFASLIAMTAIVGLSGPFGGGLGLGHILFDMKHFMLNLVFLQASGLEDNYSYNAPAWSLSVEALCYVLFLMLARKGGAWLLYGAVALALIGVVNGSPITGYFSIKIARGLAGFFLGVLLYRYRKQADLIPTPALVAFTLLMLWKSPGLFHLLQMNDGIRMSVAVWPAVICLTQRAPFNSLLRIPGFATLGDLSYSMYLCHTPVIFAMVAWNGTVQFHHDQIWLVTPIFLAATLTLSWLSYRYFETPMRHAIRGWATPTKVSGIAITLKS